MNAFLTLAVVLICAAGAGWLVYRGLRSVRSRAARWALSIVPTLIVLVAAWIVFTARAILIPASDDSMFSGRLTFELAFTGGRPGAPTPQAIKVDYPDAIKVDEDAFAGAQLTFKDGVAPSPLEASFTSGKEVSARTLQICDSTAVAVGASGAAVSSIKACSRETGGERGFRWIVRSDKPGVSMATIDLPAPIVNALTADSAGWSATVRVDGSPVEALVHADGRSFVGGESRSDIRSVPVTLSQAKEQFRSGDVEVDLGSGQITFPLRFETTMGVSAGVYDLLSKFGAIASAVLGGGWLWQLLSWRKEREKSPETPAPAAPVEPAQAPKPKTRDRRSHK